MTLHYRHTWYAGWMALAVSVLLLASQPDPGPGLFACTGLSASGLCLLTGLRGLLHESSLRWPFRTWLERAETWYPMALISFQNYFVTLALLPLWYATEDLGFPATPTLHTLLVLLFVLAPVRRIFQGTHTLTSSVRREVIMEFLRYTYVCVIALFVTLLMARLGSPAGRQPGTEPSAGAIFLWLPCTLIHIGCFVLFVDHLVRKLPPAPVMESKDTLE